MTQSSLHVNDPVGGWLLITDWAKRHQQRSLPHTEDQGAKLLFPLKINIIALFIFKGHCLAVQLLCGT